MFSKKIQSKLKQLGLRSGDKIIVTSDALKLLIYLKKNKIKYTLNNLIDDLIKIVGKKGIFYFQHLIGIFVRVKVLIIITLDL